MRIGWKTKKLCKVKKCPKKCPKNSKCFVEKYIKVLEFIKKTRIFLNKGIKHKKTYMEGVNSKNKNIKCGGSSWDGKLFAWMKSTNSQ